VPQAAERYAQSIERHREYVAARGEDLPEIVNWRWRA